MSSTREKKRDRGEGIHDPSEISSVLMHLIITSMHVNKNENNTSYLNISFIINIMNHELEPTSIYSYPCMYTHSQTCFI